VLLLCACVVNVPIAPKAETVEDFWLMIWHENVHVVVALVLLVEGDKVSILSYYCSGRFRCTARSQYRVR
jgi:protein tyrosine phosphatase